MARSEELQRWLDTLDGEPDGVRGALRGLDAGLREELMREALTDDRIADLKAKMENTALYAPNVELVLLEHYLRQPGVLSPVTLCLKGMTDRHLPSSNIIDTSALFGVAARQLCGNRPLLDHQVVASRSNVRIEYTGKRLYQSDWDVLHTLIRQSQDAFDRRHDIQPSRLLELLGLSKGGSCYDILEQTVNRLREGYLYVAVEGKNPMHLGKGPEGRYKASTGLNLIKDFTWYRGDEGEKLTFVIDSRIARLFSNSEYGLVDLEKRKLLRSNELAKKIQSLISGQMSNCQHHRMSKLLALTGLQSDMAHFTAHVLKALQVLVSAGIITAYWLSRPPRGQAQDKILVIWKERGASRDEPIPKGKGTYGDRAGTVKTLDGRLASPIKSGEPQQSLF